MGRISSVHSQQARRRPLHKRAERPQGFDYLVADEGRVDGDVIRLDVVVRVGVPAPLPAGVQVERPDERGRPVVEGRVT